MRKYLQIVDRNRASKWKRFANLIIDRIFFNRFFLVIGFAGAFLDRILEQYYFTDLLIEFSEIGRLWDMLITSILFFTYTFLMEFFTKGRTIAKYITGTKAITIDGENPTLKEYIIRNISRIVPFDFLSFLGENGWHDSWSDTRVINIEKYNAEIQYKREIEQIGNKEIA